MNRGKIVEENGKLQMNEKFKLNCGEDNSIKVSQQLKDSYF